MASLNQFTGNLDKRLSAHLVRRTTFNPSRERIQHFNGMTPQAALDELLAPIAPHMPEPIDVLTGEPWINSTEVEPESSNGQLRTFVGVWWTHEALIDKSILSKLSFFLHTNFTIHSSSGNSYDLFDYFSLLRYYALGDFKELALKISLSNLMLRYLDNHYNNASNPNENYAREFLELFTIGKGPQIGPGNYTNYTEEDVVQAAKVLTGFKTQSDRTLLDPISGVPIGRSQYSQHNQLNKVFSSSFQNQEIVAATDAEDMFRELSDFVNMIFDQDETAKAICRKLYRFFVSKNITQEIEDDIIGPLAAVFRDNDYDLKITLRTLFESEHFYDMDDSDNSDEIIGALIKSPLDLVLGSLNYFYISIPDPILDPVNHYNNFYFYSLANVMFANSGLNIFAPDVVAGYPAYYQAPGYDENWFGSTTIVARYKLPEMLLTGRRVLSGGTMGGVQLDIVDFISKPHNISDPSNANILVNLLLQHMLCEVPDGVRKNYFLNDIFLDDLSEVNWFYEWLDYIDTSDPTNVEIPLSNLITAIMYSQEYQMM